MRYLEFQRMGTVVKCSLFWNYEKELLIFNSLDLLFLREFQLNPLSQKAIILTRGNSFPFFQTIQERGHGALYMLVNFFLKKKSSVSFHVSMPFPSIILVRERKPHGFHARIRAHEIQRARVARSTRPPHRRLDSALPTILCLF